MNGNDITQDEDKKRSVGQELNILSLIVKIDFDNNKNNERK